MSLFRRREPPLPKAAVCFALPFRTRRAADWLRNLGGCRPIGVLSDDCGDVAWQCAAEQADLLLLETDFSSEIEEPKDVSSRCDIAIEVRRKLPDCRVYLVCEDGHPEKLAALEKAVELKLIDGYCLGDLTDRQASAWLRETAEAKNLAGKPAAAANNRTEELQECGNERKTADGVAPDPHHGGEPVPRPWAERPGGGE